MVMGRDGMGTGQDGTTSGLMDHHPLFTSRPTILTDSHRLWHRRRCHRLCRRYVIPRALVLTTLQPRTKGCPR